MTFRMHIKYLRAVNLTTLTCSNLPKSVAFYRNVLGAALKAEWPCSAQVALGDLGLWLKSAPKVTPCVSGSYITLYCAEASFEYTANHIAETSKQWKKDNSGSASLYFLDPDGHKFKLRTGRVQSHVAHAEQLQPNNLQIYH